MVLDMHGHVGMVASDNPLPPPPGCVSMSAVGCDRPGESTTSANTRGCPAPPTRRAAVQASSAHNA
eukprot:6654902-Lingulodinium_polyedra.AAC.1